MIKSVISRSFTIEVLLRPPKGHFYHNWLKKNKTVSLKQQQLISELPGQHERVTEASRPLKPFLPCLWVSNIWRVRRADHDQAREKVAESQSKGTSGMILDSWYMNGKWGVWTHLLCQEEHQRVSGGGGEQLAMMCWPVATASPRFHP